MAVGNLTATGKVQKKIIRDFLAGENDREKVEGWLPNDMVCPLEPENRNGGVRVDDAWRKVNGLFRAVQRESGPGTIRHL